MGKFYQVQAAVTCSFGLLLMGLLNAWPSYTIGLYTSPNTTELSAPMTAMETALLGSLPSLGAMLGTTLTGITIDRLGQKLGGVCIVMPIVICWAMIKMTSSSLVVLVARFLGGITGGASLVFGPIFISETAEDSIRGALAAFPIIFYCLGVLISYLLGWFLSYDAIIWACLSASVLSAMFSSFVAESAIFLIKQNQEEDACQSIVHYRGLTYGSEVVLEELSRLKRQLTPASELTRYAADAEKNQRESEKEKLNREEAVRVEEIKIPPWKLLCASPAGRRGFMIVAITLTLAIMMGTTPVQVYAKELFTEAVPTLSPNLCSVMYASTLVCGSVVAATIADKAGRRVLVISSSVLVALCMITLGVLKQTSVAPAWVTAVVLLLYVFCFNCGAGTVPYVLMSEVFEPEVQNFASTLLVEWNWFLNFFIIAVYPPLTKLLGTHGVFYVFATFAVLNVGISYMIVPETKGLSNEEIQEALRRRKWGVRS